MTSGRVGPVDSEVYEMRVSECQALTRRLSDPRGGMSHVGLRYKVVHVGRVLLALKRLVYTGSRPTLRRGVFSVCLDLQVTASHKR